MATIKQKKAIKVVLNGGTPTEAMREAAYAPSVIRKPYVLTKSKGYKELLELYGLTEEFITTALVDDINAKPQKRFLELSLGAEILGMKKREVEPEGKKTVVAVQIIINGTDNPESRANTETIISS